jgi:hypothetical protein
MKRWRKLDFRKTQETTRQLPMPTLAPRIGLALGLKDFTGKTLMPTRERPKLFFADLYSNDRWPMPISSVYPDGRWIDMPGSGNLRQRNDSDGHTS